MLNRLLHTIIALQISIMAFGNASFNKTVNYQYDNGAAYAGEILYPIPITGSTFEETSRCYRYFVDYERYVDGKSSIGTYEQYKLSYVRHEDHLLAGTHKRHIEGHKYRVDKSILNPICHDEYIFHMTDLNTGERVKFIYHTQYDIPCNCFETFPFITEKHWNYCKSLIGTKLVFATNQYKVMVHGSTAYYYSTYKKDIYTGETIPYDNVYAKWTIKDVVLDTVNSCLAFIVTNGKYTTQVPYSNPYYNDQNFKHNAGIRVFTEKQWNMLVNKYGEQHMAMIMDTDATPDMTDEEKYLAGGRRFMRKYSDRHSRNR